MLFLILCLSLSISVSLSTKVANKNIVLNSYFPNVGLRIAARTYNWLQITKYSLYDSEDADEKILGEDKTDCNDRVMRTSLVY